MALLCLVGNLYLFAVFGRIILSWFPMQEGTLLSQAFSFLYSITEPVLGPIRRAVPAIRFGGGGLDLSPIIVIFGLRILLGLVGC